MWRTFLCGNRDRYHGVFSPVEVPQFQFSTAGWTLLSGIRDRSRLPSAANHPWTLRPEYVGVDRGVGSSSQEDLTCHLLPKEFDDKVAKMHLSALGAELVALIVDVSPAGTSPKAVCGASCERFCGESIQEVQGTMEVPQGQYIDRITDATVCRNTKYDPSEHCTSRQHSRRLRLSPRQSSMFQKDSRDPPSAVH